MKVLVPIKRVIDPYVKIRVKSDNSGVEDNKMSMNPFDEIAVEEAIRLKEKGHITEVVLVTIGKPDCQETLRTGLALGADRALLVQTTECFQPLNIAKILKAIVEKEAPQLIIMGKQSIDGDNNQTGQMLASLLDIPQITFCSELTLDNEKVTAIRELDDGLQTLQASIPAVITTDLRLNEPRYATLPNIMKAKRKPLETISVDDLNVTLKNHSRVLTIEEPKTRSQGIKVNSVDELIAKLADEEQVI